MEGAIKTDIQSAPGADPAPPKRLLIVRADLRLAGASPLAVSIFGLVALSLLFVWVPAIDLTVSSWFYFPGEGFELRRNGIFRGMRNIGRILPVMVAVAAFGLLVAALFSSRTSGTGRPAHSVFLLTTLALGPGLIVNALLKNNWGRARPRETLGFGGDWPFTPAWLDVDHCVRNCSFVSGEASAAFWLVSLAFIVPASHRARTLAATLPFAMVVSLNRVVYGAHYLSDIVIAWAIICVVLAASSRLILCETQAVLIDHWFERLRGLRRPAKFGPG